MENPEVTTLEQKQNIVKNTENNSNVPRVLREIFDWVEAGVFACFIVVLIFTFAFRLVTVDGESMLDTFHHEDRVIISNFMYEPKQFDVVVLVQPTFMENHPLIKRILALSGDTIYIDNVNNTVSVNGIVLQEDYIYEKIIKRKPFYGAEPYVVPDGCVFVMGDNRNNSNDSRDDMIGPIPAKNILGHVVFRIMPLNRFGFIEG